MATTGETNFHIPPTHQDYHIPGIEQDIYLEELRTTLETIRSCVGGEDSNKGWYVIGGLPIDAYMGERHIYTSSIEKGTRDMDILPHIETLPRLHEAKRQNRTRVTIDMPYHPILHIENTEASLNLGKYKSDLDPKIFNTQMVNLCGVEFPTLSPMTLLHLYTVGIAIHGSLRLKDFSNALRLARLTREESGGIYRPGKEYEPFHRFLKNSGYAEYLPLKMLRLYRKLKLQHWVPLDGPLLQPYMEFIWRFLSK